MSKPLALLLAGMAMASTLHGQTLGSIEPPPGFKPVLKKQADGKWNLSFVPDGTTPAGSGKTGPGKVKAASSTPPKSRPDLEKSLQTQITHIDWSRELSAVPAFVALDVAPETVARPNTPRDFAAALLNGVDRRGTLQTGIALETAPYQLLLGRTTSLEQYRQSYWTRLLYRTSLSLGTAKASNGDDKSQRLALGVSVTLFDRDDPYTNRELDQFHADLLRKYHAPSAAELAGGLDPSASDEELRRQAEAATASFDRHFDEMNAEYLAKLEEIKHHWGRTAWNVACAPSWISTSGKADDLRGDGFAAWTTFAYGFENTALQDRVQLLAHLRYRQGEHVVDPEDTTRKGDQDSLFAAASLRFHVEKQQLNFGLEGAYIQIWDGPNGDGHTQRVGGVVEKKLSDNTWLVLSFGQDFGAGGSKDELFAIGSLRFGTEDKARFAP